jgi:hypothetical protein
MQEGVNGTFAAAAATGPPGYPVQSKPPSPQKQPANATVPYNQGSGSVSSGGLNPYPVFPAGGTGYPVGPANSTGSYPHSNSPTPPYSTSATGGSTIVNGNGNPKGSSNTFTSYESHQSPSQRFVAKESGGRPPDAQTLGQFSNSPVPGPRSEPTPRPRERSAEITLPTIPKEFPEIKNLSNFQLEKLSSDEVALMVKRFFLMFIEHFFIFLFLGIIS